MTPLDLLGLCISEVGAQYTSEIRLLVDIIIMMLLLMPLQREEPVGLEKGKNKKLRRRKPMVAEESELFDVSRIWTAHQ
jgi:hypothetical protein